MKSIGQIIHQNIFSLYIFNCDGYIVYYEHSAGFWVKHKYDSTGHEIYYENSRGYVEDNRP